MRALPWMSLLLLAGCAHAPAPQATAPAAPVVASPAPPVPPPTLDMGPVECAVWARELGFAESVARHDAQAFAGFVHPDAVFSMSAPKVVTGRAAILKAWAGMIAGTTFKLSWYPTRVVVNAQGDLAWSTGPALFEPSGGPWPTEPMLSLYMSVWRRDTAGTWQVVFDDGLEPVPATPAQVAAFHAKRQTGCPWD